VALSRSPGTRAARLTLGAAVAVALLAGCGQPSHQFLSSTEDDVVVRIPTSWTVVRTGQLQTSASAPAPGSWFADLDGSSSPGRSTFAQHTVSQPVAIARTIVLSATDAGSVSDNDLRDLVLPVSPSARANLLVKGTDGVKAVAKSFVQLGETPVQTSTGHGFHLTFSFDLGEGVQVFDQMAMTNLAQTREYLLLVQCSRACWDAQHQSIDDAVRSLAVKVP
jgi:hypothetical protein